MIYRGDKTVTLAFGQVFVDVDPDFYGICNGTDIFLEDCNIVHIFLEYFQWVKRTAFKIPEHRLLCRTQTESCTKKYH